MSKKSILVIPFLLCSLFALAQNLRLTGKVVNAKNEPIAGATISIEGAPRAFAADVEGRFIFSAEAGKKYTIKVSAAGFNTKVVEDVEVKANEDNSITVVLEDKTLAEVEVRTSVRKESTSALINFQKNNSSLSSGLAADFIRRTPDKNTGELLKRVSGASIQDNKFVIVRGLSDRYNTALINNSQLPSTEPDKKAFSFDVIPSVLIDNIVINKTATPELTSEFAGGLVQITTKDVPTKDILNVGVSFGFNTNSAFKDFYNNPRGNTDWLGFDDGQRKLPGGFPANRQNYGKLLEQVGGSIKQAELSRLFKSDVYKEEKNKALPIQTYNITYGIGRKLKNEASLGIIAAVIYRNSMLKYDVSRQLNEFNGNAIRQFTDAQNRYSTNLGGIFNITYAQKKTKVSLKNLFNQYLEDNYYTRSGYDYERSNDVSFRSSYLNQRSLYSGQLEAERQLTKSGIKLKLNGNLSYNWKTQPDLRTSSFYRASGTNNAFELNYDETNRFFSDLKDYSYGGGGVVIVPFKWLNEKQTFKAGGSTLIRIRDFKARTFRYAPAASEIGDLRKLPFDEIFNPENISEKGFVIEENTQNEDKYFGVSGLNSGFAMLDNKLSDKIRLIWGVRVENFHQVLTSRRSDLKRVVVDTDKWDVLPSANFVYNVNNSNIIRVSASQTIARPEFREIAPFSFYDYEQNYSVSGDTTLKRTSILNLDLRYEWYPKPGEALSVGVFYKNFKDPIELRALSSSALTRRQYSFQNADEASTYGIELEARKNLDFIGGAFKNFSIFSNITFIKSEVSLQTQSGGGTKSSFSRPLQGQSPYLINASLQYTNPTSEVNASLIYNRVGQRISLVGGLDFGLYDIYERPRDQVDFQIGKKVLGKRGEVKLTVGDIFNQPFYFYENVDSKKAYKSGTDRLFYSYTPGTTFTIGFSYDFIK